MNRTTGIALALAAAAHAAVAFGVRFENAPPEPPRSDENQLEVALFAPPPPPAPEALPPDPVPEMAPPELPSPAPEPPPAAEPPPAPEPPAAPAASPMTEPEPPVAPEKSAKPVVPPAPAPKPAARPAPRTKPAEPRARPAPVPAAPRPARPAAGNAGNGPAVPQGYQAVGSLSRISRGRAAYPRDALRQKQTGTVLLLLYVNESGKVDRVEVARSSGVPSLDAAAAAAERRSTFRPAVSGGRPVKSRVQVPYTFSLGR